MKKPKAPHFQKDFSFFLAMYPIAIPAQKQVAKTVMLSVLGWSFSFGDNFRLPLLEVFDDTFSVLFQIWERTAKPRHWCRTQCWRAQRSSPSKPKPLADDGPFVSPDHIHHPVVFNNVVMLRVPASFR